MELILDSSLAEALDRAVEEGSFGTREELVDHAIRRLLSDGGTPSGEPYVPAQPWVGDAGLALLAQAAGRLPYRE